MYLPIVQIWRIGTGLLVSELSLDYFVSGKEVDLV